MHLSKKSAKHSAINIFKTSCLSIKNNKLLFHNSVHSATLHTDHTDNVDVPAHSTAHTCSLHAVIEHARPSSVASLLVKCDNRQQHQTELDPPIPFTPPPWFRDRPRRQICTADSMVVVISHPSSRGCCCCIVNVFRFCVFPLSKSSSKR